MIKTKVAKLGSLADDCSRMSSNLSSVVNQSRQILDNSFLSSQQHLCGYVSSLHYDACMEIAMAMGTYEEYVDTMEEMVMAHEQEEEEMVNKWEELDVLAKKMFEPVKCDNI